MTRGDYSVGGGVAPIEEGGVRPVRKSHLNPKRSHSGPTAPKKPKKAGLYK
jgi:hypothetical protein